MTDRDRLIELITQKQNWGQTYEKSIYTHNVSNSELADHLIANGVILSPILLIGEKLYFLLFNNKSERSVVEGEITKIDNDKSECVAKLKDGREVTFIISFFGKTVFLTREEAEKAL